MNLQGYKDLIEWAFRSLCWLFVWGLVISAAINATPLGRDDSDESRWFGQRSEVKVITDAKTGMQYLATRGGGITPRLDQDGKHVRSEK